MSYANVGATDKSTGQRFKSKKALKDALTNAPDTVVFDGTAMPGMGPKAPTTVAELKADSDIKLSVCGPDPYTKRNWHATVEITDKGTVKMS